MNEISTALKTLTDKITVKLEIGEKHFNVFLCLALCVENILYSVELKPMHNAKGHVVVAATPVLFQAHVETIIVPKTLYQVTVTFGNKKIFFDPKDGKSAMSRTIDGVLEILKGRKDIRHQENVINDYLNQAQALVRRMESDGFIYTKNGHSGRSK